MVSDVQQETIENHVEKDLVPSDPWRYFVIVIGESTLLVCVPLRYPANLDRREVAEIWAAR